jgi:hypothetical protein
MNEGVYGGFWGLESQCWRERCVSDCEGLRGIARDWRGVLAPSCVIRCDWKRIGVNLL